MGRRPHGVIGVSVARANSPNAANAYWRVLRLIYGACNGWSRDEGCKPSDGDLRLAQGEAGSLSAM